MRRRAFGLVGGSLTLLLAACGDTTAVTDACAVDKAIQPVAAPAVGALAPQTAGAVAVDQAIVHPLVTAGCNSLPTPPVPPAAKSGS